MLQKQFILYNVKETLQYLGKISWTTMRAMSLSSLIYSKMRRIASVDNIILMMIVGNQLYSSLSLLN